MAAAKLLKRLAGGLAGMILFAISLSAQQGGVPVDQVHAGVTLIALSNVLVRDRAPGSGALYVLGQQTGTLKPDEIISVSREQMVLTLLGSQKWVYFARSGESSPSSGWVLVGKAGSTSESFGAKH